MHSIYPRGSVGWPANRLIVRAWNALLQLDGDGAEGLLQQLQQVRRETPRRRAVLAQHETLLAAGLALVRDDVEAASALAQSVSRHEQSEEMARVTSVLLRFCAWRRMDWVQFDAATCICPCSLIDKRLAIPTILNLVLEAAAAVKRSRFLVARRLATDALRFAAKRQAASPFAVASAAAVLGGLLYEQGELDEAEKLLRRYLAQVVRCGSADVVEAAYTTLASVARYKGQSKVAALLVHEVVTLGKLREWPRLIGLGYSHEIALHCRLGDRARADMAMQQFQALLDGGVSPTTRTQLARLAYEGRLRLSLLEAPSQEGVLALRALIALYRHDGDDLHALKLSVQLVETLALLGRCDEAGAELLASLKTGMQSGVFQLFLCGSAILYKKLRSLYSRELSTAGGLAELRPYVASLIGREHERVVAKDGMAGVASKSSITVREREILLRMSRGHSNKKIARDLGIGPETVKSHAKRIFFKLGVTKRIEAVTCASDLSLI